MTKIEWTRGDDGSKGETWNPLAGCEWASPGCDGCYAARDAFGRLSRTPTYEGLAIRRAPTELPRFTGEIRLLPDRLDQPIRWRRPRRIFVNSMSDLFHPKVPRGFIADVFATMAIAQHHQFQVLTKRPGRAAKLLADEAFRLDVEERIIETGGFSPRVWPLPNVWLGTSIESEDYAWRARQLAEAPAAVRFLSIESMTRVGKKAAGRHLDGRTWDQYPAELAALDA